MTLDDYIKKTYAADPVLAARFANTFYRLAHVSRRWWRGYKVMGQDSEVRLSGVKLNDEATTKPRWKLIPDVMKDEFLTLERTVDQVLSMYCVSGSGEQNDTKPVLTGGGNYAVQADNWARVRQILRVTQERWAEAADKWCSEEGYEKLHDELKVQLGTDYDRAKDLVPPRDELRSKFGLVVREVPVRIVEEPAADAQGDDDRLAVFAELVAGSVRRPRVEMAEAVDSLARQLVADGPLGPAPRRRTRENKDGSKTDIGRGVTGRAVLAARRAVDATARCGRAADAPFLKAAAAARAELPDAEDAARITASRLNADDAEAVRVGTLLLAAAVVAADEKSMCDAVAEAFAPAGRKGGVK